MTLRCDNHVWTLTAPDGRQWTGASGLLAAAAEQRERILPEVRLQRILKAVSPTQDEIDAARYRWLRANTNWVGFELFMEPDEMDASIDHEMRSAE